MARPVQRALATAVLLGAGAVAVAPDTAAAQDETSFYATPFIGVAFFPSDLTEADENFGAFKVQNGPAYGVNAGAARLFGNLGLEALLVYSPAVTLADIVGTSGVLGFDTDIVIYGANVTYALADSRSAVVPTLSAGAGALSYSLDFGDDTIDNSETDIMFDLGISLDLAITESIAVRFDLRDYINTTKSADAGESELFTSDGEDGSTQQNIFLTAGLRIGS